METSIAEESALKEKNNVLYQVTPLSKYLAMFLFVTLPFVGGVLGYYFSPEKITELSAPYEVTKFVYETNEPLIQENKIDLSLVNYGDAGGEWIKFYLNADLQYSIIAGELVNGGYCYLGLCEEPAIDTVTSARGVVWEKLSIENCVGGCGALGSVYRATYDTTNYYFLVWNDSDIERGLTLLDLFSIDGT